MSSRTEVFAAALPPPAPPVTLPPSIASLPLLYIICFTPYKSSARKQELCIPRVFALYPTPLTLFVMPVFVLIAILAMIGLRYGVGTAHAHVFSPFPLYPHHHPVCLKNCNVWVLDYWQRKDKKSFLLVSFLGLWLFPFFWYTSPLPPLPSPSTFPSPSALATLFTGLRRTSFGTFCSRGWLGLA